MHDVAYAIDRLIVPAGDDIPHKQPRAFGWALRINLDDQNTASRA
jgi:hypothetical protein